MSTWEERMSLRTREREAARAALAAEIPEPCEIGDPDMLPGHQGHHWHVDGNAIVCSCGSVGSCWSFVPDPRYWSDDPAEVAAVQREHREWLDSISCSVCGKRGVLAGQDWGQQAKPA